MEHSTRRGGDSDETTSRQPQHQLASTDLSFRVVQSNRRRLYVCEVSGHRPRRNVYPLSTSPGEEGPASSGVPGTASRGELDYESHEPSAHLVLCAHVARLASLRAVLLSPAQETDIMTGIEIILLLIAGIIGSAVAGIAGDFIATHYRWYVDHRARKYAKDKDGPLL